MAVCQSVVPNEQCQFKEESLVQLEVARQTLADAFKETGKIDTDARDCYLTAYNAVLVCAKAQTCDGDVTYTYGRKHPREIVVTLPKLHKDLGQGWSEQFRFGILGKPGSCTFDEKSTYDSANLISPSGKMIANVNHANSNTDRMITLTQGPQCETPSGKGRRIFTASRRGLMVTDSASGRMSHAKMVEVLPNKRAPRYQATTSGALRITWPNDANIDLDENGAITASSFLQESSWDTATCLSVPIDQKRFVPEIKLRPEVKKKSVRLRAKPVGPNDNW